MFYLLFVWGSISCATFKAPKVCIVTMTETVDTKVVEPAAAEQAQWFAMRATFRREITARDLLEEKGISCFVPMHYAVREHRGRKMKVLEPVIHNLIFANAPKSQLQQVKQRIPFLQYMTRHLDGRNVPIVVPPKQMQDFMAVCNTYSEELIFLKPEELNLKPGTKVRIHGGPFDGLVGNFVKVVGKRNRRVVISIQNVIAVAVAEVKPDLLEVLDD